MPFKMYEVKPILNQKCISVDLPTTMYKIKSIYEQSNLYPSIENSSESVGVTKGNAEMEALQKRQVVIIEQLKDLKARLLSMHKQLGVGSKPAQVNQHEKSTKNGIQSELKPINTKLLQDVVINAHPKNIPYSLVALQRVWRNRLHLIVNCYTHSTISSLPEANAHFAQQLSKHTTSNNSLPTLTVSLIWKDVPTTELLCAPATFIPIYGEVNVLRHFSRIGPNEYAYETTSHDDVQINSILDLCHLLVSVTTARDRQSILWQLNGVLGNGKFFGGSVFNISDLAISSAIKQLSISAKDISPNLTKWLKSVSTLFGY